MTHHVFVSPSGDMLPRWREAFPSARCVAFQAVGGSRLTAGTVWLRLDGGRAVAEQLSFIHSCLGQAPVVVLSDRPNDQEALSAFSAAAKGYCNSHATAELLRQIDAVVSNGGLWIGEALVHRLVGTLSRIPVAVPAEMVEWEAILTHREYEVAQAVCAGASNKEVAQQLQITERTVKAHIGSVFEKLNVRDRLQLALLFKSQEAVKA
jgi:two-component system, NarL family, nitrate/nitrite response regulator NarL